MASVADSAGGIARSTAEGRLVTAWLSVVAALVFAIVIVGGATRLTESGLSITEWELVTGILPPLSEAAWLAEFEKYRQIPQYQALHRGFSLAEFQTIYLWEWGHRLLGRVIGAAMALPFFAFLIARRLDADLALKTFGITCLVGLQGAIGWWMVSSGLEVRIRVAPYRLATHLTIAVLIFSALWWLILARTTAKRISVPRRLTATATALIVLTLIQTFLGGLVAGSRAGWSYNTWPLMDGWLWPSGMLVMQPWWANFAENTGTVQFVHRTAAYALLALAFWHMIDCRRTSPGVVGQSALIAAHLLLLQAVIGIATVLTVVWMPVALLHQAGIIVVMAGLLWHRVGLIRAG